MPDSMWIALATAAAPQLEDVGAVSRRALHVGRRCGLQLSARQARRRDLARPASVRRSAAGSEPVKLAAWIATLLLLAACGGAEDSKALASGYLQALLVEQAFERWDEFFAPDAHINGSGFARRYMEETARGLATGFPDLALIVDEQLVDGDSVVTRFTLEGTHDGPFSSVAPTGRRVRFRGVAVDRLVEGRIVSSWQYIDLWSAAQQLIARDRSAGRSQQQ